MFRRAAPKKVKLPDSRSCLTRHKRASKVALPEEEVLIDKVQHLETTEGKKTKEKNKIKNTMKKE